jgi:dihydroorotate dehydrogenase
VTINLYPLAKSILFKLEAERAHHLGLTMLKAAHTLHMSPLIFGKPVHAPVKVMGIEFPNPVGLAAGLDKNGDYYAGLSACGFGFVEIGTVTPRPQPGNPQPRLFRLPAANAIINRMGFNNLGVDYLIKNVEQTKFEGVLGINIGKNFDTPVENATADYLIGLNKVYPHADYVTVNISSPNTPGLRDLQFGEALDKLLAALKREQAKLADVHGRYVPLAVKIAPDMDDVALRQLADSFVAKKIDAVIATNTTLSRKGVEGMPHANEQGGLSGEPLRHRADYVVSVLSLHLQGALPVIAAGGINSAADALHKLQAGASLVQIYSGFIYQGPKLVQDCARALSTVSSTAA